ncbi:hypothetical protein Afil01_50700 [Actinorhabdospora filicis]|uniref:Zinc finger CGNR domain-containing protein n=1 Tax=Actinorhabdospora filicis TaxID=1785913 RepID=A0A9W6SQH9_9ACTN|nr:CGNR zinc finger domain-containing protein [Actinorhabdospora filicis]GLZ80263.1 hypothetical protein Afil01_50700 [Actinorhabdospora filicis]
MNLAGHLAGNLDAALALAEAYGPEHRRGRPREEPGPGAITEALRLATNTAPHVGDRSRAVLAEGGAALHTAFTHLVDGELDAGTAVINRILRDTHAAPALVRHNGGPWHLHFSPHDGNEAGDWLADLATATAVLAGGHDLTRLRVCQAERCDVVFLDATRSATRRFCSTACQNRTKVAAHRAREAAR